MSSFTLQGLLSEAKVSPVNQQKKQENVKKTSVLSFSFLSNVQERIEVL